MKKAYSLSKSSDELKKLIAENPELPIVVLVGEGGCEDSAWTYCTNISFSIDEILNCDYLDFGDTVFTDRDRLEEKISDDLYDEYHERPEAEYDAAVRRELLKYEPYWERVITIWASN